MLVPYVHTVPCDTVKNSESEKLLNLPSFKDAVTDRMSLSTKTSQLLRQGSLQRRRRIVYAPVPVEFECFFRHPTMPNMHIT